MDDSTNETAWFSNEAATFGDRVAAAREGLGLSDEDLARKLGVKLKTVRAWEQDMSEPRANKLQMLSGVLNVSLRWLLTGEGQGVEVPGSSVPLRPEVAGLLTELREMRAQMSQTAERLGVIEKRLQATLREDVG
ncbi:MAG: helix-turn-helix domain-containing protein [Alphaproteobacteria bacterium]|nr:helix-turn-helix domain-containing protein [Alphaproteobacteria bacterium]NNF73473.1 helix-turn-helix transcriptional regulator [Paracoccaceae bacterium]